MLTSIYKNEIEIRLGQLDALIAQKFKTAGDVNKFILLRDELYSLTHRFIVCQELFLGPKSLEDEISSLCGNIEDEVDKRLKESQTRFEKAARECNLILPPTWYDSPQDRSRKRFDPALEAASLTQAAHNDLSRLDAVLQLSHQANDLGANTASALHNQKGSMTKTKAGLQEIGQHLKETSTIAAQTAQWFGSWRS